jgi:pimeloyl-ACP methyl ester carboxylesterase
MVAPFLGPEAHRLTEPASIALAAQINRVAVAAPFFAEPLATACVCQGSGGTPLLLLHGFDSSVLEFRRLLPLLAAQQETWAVDLLGFGFTDRPTAVPIDPSRIKTHLYYSWKTLIGRPVVLVGASMGGAAAIDFATTYPEAVTQVVLIDSAGFAQGPDMGKFLVPPLGYLAAEFLRQPAVRRQVSLKAYVDSSLVTEDALLCAALHLQMPNWHRAMITFTKSGGYTRLQQRISRVTQPTYILWGDSDQILGTQDAARFQQAIPHSQLTWIEACGHVPHLEKPQLTAEAILDWLHSA